MSKTIWTKEYAKFIKKLRQARSYGYKGIIKLPKLKKIEKRICN